MHLISCFTASADPHSHSTSLSSLFRNSVGRSMTQWIEDPRDWEMIVTLIGMIVTVIGVIVILAHFHYKDDDTISNITTASKDCC